MITSNKLNKLIFIFFLFISITSFGQVRLPKLISDGMVLQRDAEIKIWGWASEGEMISVHFIKTTLTATADNKGNWSIVLPKLDAGGPYNMEIDASNSITIHDIMIGDVWLCSGQSNMELAMARVSWNYPGEIANSENKYIRQFIVPQRYNFNKPEKDLPNGIWKNASPENTPAFSAAAYFFGKELFENIKYPSV